MNSQRDSTDDLAAFVGRQPIFDCNKEVFAYELLFRSGNHNANLSGDGDHISARLINNSLNVMGLPALTGGKKAFINTTRQMLLNADYTVLPRESVVIELLENITADPEVIEACRVLKDAGYILALDDFISAEGYAQMLEMADIVKVDFMDTTAQQRQLLVQQLRPFNVQLLAEKVETHEEYEEARRLGHIYFQGFFFCKPQIIKGRDIAGNAAMYLQLLQEINQPEVDFDRLEKLIRGDVSLSYKLLNYLNSAAMGMRQKITSLKHGMVLLGLRPLKKWVSLVAMTCVNEDKPSELMITSLVRARFCEQIGELTGRAERQMDLFMMGMFSLLGSMLDQPLATVIAPMPLADDVKQTLFGKPTEISGIYDLAIARERADEAHATKLAQDLQLSRQQTDEACFKAVSWAGQVANG